MKTLVIGYNHHFNDKRVMRTVMALKKLGTVYYQYAGNSEELIDGVKTFPLKKPHAENRLRYYVQRREFDKEILKLAEILDYDLAYFHYFPASMPVKIFKTIKKLGKSLIYDLHEIIPVQFLPEKFERITPLMWIIFRKQLLLSDALISVSQEAMDFMLKKSKISRPFLIVENYANHTVEQISEDKKKEIVIVGKSTRNNDIVSEILISLKNEGFSFKSIGIKSNLTDVNLPFLPYNKMMKELSKSAFSIIAYQNRKSPDYPNEVFSLPNKFFDSLAARTPVILSNRFRSMRKILEETGTGVIINLKDDPKKNVRKVLKAWENYSDFQSALIKHSERFYWTKEKEEKFLDFVKTFI
ncbi:MAG: glycosyl transferase family 1 [Kosmotoga sp.]|uniref:hypothetical protein n=1 Tax=Kosmotoga sp. TaxID=1955248 RepID=UPI001DA18D38|nr:hypothetical protein [Kosmotoga sp.]MBO8166288.1 glycosyl transferase family 1 [Kosmotoga sp.]